MSTDVKESVGVLQHINRMSSDIQSDPWVRDIFFISKLVSHLYNRVITMLDGYALLIHDMRHTARPLLTSFCIPLPPLGSVPHERTTQRCANYINNLFHIVSTRPHRSPTLLSQRSHTSSPMPPKRPTVKS